MSRPAILRVGLTGGIASGKSTVAGFLGALGAEVLDADAIAHRAIEPGGSAHDDVIARFGDRIVGDDGRIDRGTLGNIVFRDRAARADLEALVHPAVREDIVRRIERIGSADRSGIVVVDAALLVETGGWREYHRLVVTDCPVEVQVRRLRERDGLDAVEADRRIAAQAPLEDKLALADYVVRTAVPMDETRREAEAVWARLRDDRDALRDGRLSPPRGLREPGPRPPRGP